MGVRIKINHRAVAALATGPEVRALHQRKLDDMVRAAMGRARVDTGKMRDSIGSTQSVTGSKVVGAVTIDDDEAKVMANEFGHKSDPGKPFIRPAVDDVKEV